MCTQEYCIAIKIRVKRVFSGQTGIDIHYGGVLVHLQLQASSIVGFLSANLANRAPSNLAVGVVACHEGNDVEGVYITATDDQGDSGWARLIQQAVPRISLISQDKLAELQHLM